MSRINRELNRPLNWLIYAKKNNLHLENIKIEKGENYINKEKNFKFDLYYDVSFHIYYKKKVISLVNIKLDLEYQNFSNNKIFLQSIYDRLEDFEYLTYSQNLIMSYLNKEESILFDKNIGDHIILLKKQTCHKGNIFLYEEEISRINSYSFKEAVF